MSDDARRPVAGARVSLTTPSGSSTVMEVVTGADGHFRMGPVEPGTWRFTGGGRPVRRHAPPSGARAHLGHGPGGPHPRPARAPSRGASPTRRERPCGASSCPSCAPGPMARRTTPCPRRRPGRTRTAASSSTPTPPGSTASKSPTSASSTCASPSGRPPGTCTSRCVRGPRGGDGGGCARPAAGAVPRAAAGPGIGGRPGPPPRAHTDERGRFHLQGVKPGHYVLTASREMQAPHARRRARWSWRRRPSRGGTAAGRGANPLRQGGGRRGQAARGRLPPGPYPRARRCRASRRRTAASGRLLPRAALPRARTGASP